MARSAAVVLLLLALVGLSVAWTHWDLQLISSVGAPTSAGASGASSVAYDFVTNSVFVANREGNRVDIFSLGSTGALTHASVIPSAVFSGGNVRNVAVHTGVLAVSLEALDIVSPGSVLLIDTSTLKVINTIKVGSSPGHLVWTRTGRRLIVANAGRPSDDYRVNPVGSVSIIRLADKNEFNRVNIGLLSTSIVVNSLNFTSYTRIDSIINSDAARITGINATIATDLEPSHISLGDFAYKPRVYVTCQLNNVFVEIDLIAEKIVRMTALPFRDFSRSEYGFDASDADGKINIATWPVRGIPGPAASAFFYLHDKHYLVFANQGKARINAAYNEQRIVNAISLDGNRFNVSYLQQPAQLGNLAVSVNGADTNNDGLFDRLYAFGSRSISVWRLNSTESNEQIWESGDSIERAVAVTTPNTFNAAASNPAGFDITSPRSGPEPAALAIGKIDYHKLLFVALNQQGTILAYSLSKPSAPRIVAYSANRDANPAMTTVDRQPQDLVFIPSASNPSKLDLLVVANQASGTTTVYHVVRLDPPAAPLPPTSWEETTAPARRRRGAQLAQ